MIVNTYVGRNAGSANPAGFGNAFMGAFAGNTNTGIHNTLIGGAAGLNNNGPDNVFLGYFAGAEETGPDKLYIANSSTNTLIFGLSSGLCTSTIYLKPESNKFFKNPCDI